MNRIRVLLRNRNKRKMLVPFFTAGYPDFETSLKLVAIASDCGADIIEIGVPFSDPVADGPAIQYSSQVALKNGINLQRILKGVEKLRRSVNIPVVLMGYTNPILAYGFDRFVQRAKSAGVDGLIIPDLPVDEAYFLSRMARKSGISLIFLVAPTSDSTRIRLADDMSDDFVYAVTVTGVTGSRRTIGNTTDKYLKSLRKRLTKPFVAGFGVSSPSTARKLSLRSDGVVIGSAFIDIIRNARSRKSAMYRITRLLADIRTSIDK